MGDQTHSFEPFEPAGNLPTRPLDVICDDLFPPVPPGASQFARLLREAKVAYEVAHPETAKGRAQGDGAKRRAGQDLTARLAASFVKQVHREAVQRGHQLSERRIFRVLAQAEGIEPDVLALVAGTSCDQDAFLEHLKKNVPRSEQLGHAIQRIAAGPASRRKLSSADNPILGAFLRAYEAGNESERTEGCKLVGKFIIAHKGGRVDRNHQPE